MSKISKSSKSNSIINSKSNQSKSNSTKSNSTKSDSKKVLSLIWNNKKRAALIVLFDLLFYALFFMISPILFSYISPTKDFFSTLSFIGMNWLIVMAVFIFFLFTYFSLMLIYSFCKYLVLMQFIKIDGKRANFSKLLDFYRANISPTIPIIVLPIILIFMNLTNISALNLILGAIGGIMALWILFTTLPALILVVLYFLLPVLRDVPNINFLGVFWLTFLSILFLFLYFILNARHSLFSAGKKSSFAAGLDELSSLKKYKSLLIANLISIGVFFLLFSIIGYSIQYLVKSFKIGANIYNIYEPTFAVFFGLLTYSIFFFNRAYFYYAAREKK